MLNPNGYYLVYLRKSRTDREDEKQGETETLARHEHILLELAGRLHIQITAIYREVVSGESIAARPFMTRLLSEVEQGCWNGILVMEVERLARGDTVDQGIVAQAFKYSDTRIITPAKIYDPRNEFDEEYFEFGLFMSRREYKTINRRLQYGREQSAKEGKYIGNVAPYGYERRKLPSGKGFTLSPFPPQDKIVAQIFTWFVYGSENGSPMGISAICRKLNCLCIPSPKGGKWTDSTISGILQNPVYIGKIRFQYRPVVKTSVKGSIQKSRPRSPNQKLYDGLHPSIVPTDLFLSAHKRLSDHSPRAVPSGYTVQNPLSGLVFCARCGRKMERRPCASDENTLLICPSSGCPTVGSRLFSVEEKIVDALHSIIKEEIPPNECFYPAARFSHISNTDILNQLQKELSALAKKQEKLCSFLEQGIYTPELFTERLQKLQEQKAALHTARQKLETEQQNETKNEKQTAEYKETGFSKSSLLQNYYLLTPEQRNHLLKQLIDHVTYQKDVRNRKGEGSIPSFELHIYPKVISYL